MTLRRFLQSFWTFLIRERVGFYRELPLTSPEERAAADKSVLDLEIAFLDAQLDIARRRHS